MICDCGCGERMEKGLIQFDHELPLHLGGTDTLDNLRAVRTSCHKKKTIAEAKARGKVRRIQKSKGLTKKRPNKKEKMLQYFKTKSRMP